MTTLPTRTSALATTLAVAALAVVALALTACGSTRRPIIHEHPDPDSHGPIVLPTPLAGALAPDPSPSIVSAQTATPTGAIIAYATAYARTSTAALAARQTTLAAYATPALARSLGASAPTERAQTARALPAGAQMTGAAEALALHSISPTTARGVISVTQTLVLRRQEPQRPVVVDYRFTLTHDRAGWRVASFTPIVEP